MANIEEDPAFQFISFVERFAQPGAPIPEKQILLSAKYAVAKAAKVGLVPVEEVTFQVSSDRVDNELAMDEGRPSDDVYHSIIFSVCGYELLNTTYGDAKFTVYSEDTDVAHGEQAQATAIYIVDRLSDLFMRGQVSFVSAD